MEKRVLLIEDEPSIIEAIRFILTRDGWSVQTHSNGITAADRVREGPPDVVILDVMLPGRSGLDILEELRGDPAMADLPILILTARGQSADRDRAEQGGASRYMTKPFSNSDILAAVNSLVGPK